MRVPECKSSLQLNIIVRAPSWINWASLTAHKWPSTQEGCVHSLVSLFPARVSDQDWPKIRPMIAEEFAPFPSQVTFFKLHYRYLTEKIRIFIYFSGFIYNLLLAKVRSPGDTAIVFILAWILRESMCGR